MPTVTKTDYCRKTPTNISGYADDKHTMDAVLDSVRKGVKPENGKRKKANLTIVNLPTIDSTGHRTAPVKKYRKAASADTDAQTRSFRRQQKKLGLWSRTVMFLVSDHSMDTTPDKVTLREVLIAAGIPAESFTVVAERWHGHGVPRRSHLPGSLRPSAPDAAGRVGPPSGIDEALYREPNPTDGDAANTLDGAHPAWHFNGERTGDLVVTHATGGAFSDPINPTTGGHGGPFTTDNFFAITGGWKGLAKTGTVSGVADARFDDTQANPGQAENVDVAPTALRVLGLEPPRDNRGRVLTEAFKGW